MLMMMKTTTALLMMMMVMNVTLMMMKLSTCRWKAKQGRRFDGGSADDNFMAATMMLITSTMMMMMIAMWTAWWKAKQGRRLRLVDLEKRQPSCPCTSNHYHLPSSSSTSWGSLLSLKWPCLENHDTCLFHWCMFKSPHNCNWSLLLLSSKCPLPVVPPQWQLSVSKEWMRRTKQHRCGWQKGSWSW